MTARSSQPLQASVLDRLIDDNPGNIDLSPKRRAIGLRTLRQNVRRDLENLLNAKMRWNIWPANFNELNQSLVNYGLPDFACIAMDSVEGRLNFCREIERSIRQFEPRFLEVSVSLKHTEIPEDRVLQLRIDALLHADPQPAYITFDSDFEPINQGIIVKDVG